jgi:RNA polymerase sigma-70 factor (ECF subfamily)
MIEAQTDRISDEALISLVKKNHSGAINELINRHKVMVFNLALRLLGNFHEAEEAAQDTFVKAIQSIHEFRADSQLGTWLYRICFNTCITYKRKKRLNTFSLSKAKLEEHPTTQLLCALEQKDNVKYLNQALSTLSSSDIAIVSLFYMDDLPTHEIAKVIGISEGNVRVKLHRARNILKDQLKKILNNEVLNL